MILVPIPVRIFVVVFGDEDPDKHPDRDRETTKIGMKIATKMRAEDTFPQHQDAHCPACERYIGAADVCPYCDTDSSRPPVFRHLRAAVWVLATAGLAMLWVCAGRRVVPELLVADITPMMNFATVRVAGEVVGKPYTRRRGDRVVYASFSLRDTSGSVRVAAYDRVAEDLAACGPGSWKGARVAVIGRLDVAAGRRPVLRVQSAEHVTVLDSPGAQD